MPRFKIYHEITMRSGTCVRLRIHIACQHNCLNIIATLVPKLLTQDRATIFKTKLPCPKQHEHEQSSADRERLARE